MRLKSLAKTAILCTLLSLTSCVSMKPTEFTDTQYVCEYPSQVDMMPVGTVKVTEYTQTGITEAYISSNSQLDIANNKLLSIGEFVRRAKIAQAKANQN